MKEYINEFSIYTLGRFLIKKGNQVLASDIQEMNKQWKLFFYLLFHANETVTHRELINSLNLAENDYPQQSLRGLVYRLRKNLSDDKDNPIVITKRKGYRFNHSHEFWMDCLEFARLVEKGNALADEDDNKVNLYQRALQLYHGPFLDNHNIEPWLLEKRNDFHDLYLDTTVEAAELLLDRNQNKEAVDVYETALRIYPYEVELHEGLFDSLKIAGMDSMARNRAEESVMLLQEANLSIPDRLKEEAYFVSDSGGLNDPLGMLEKNGPQEESVFACGPITFSNIFNLEKRRARRTKSNIFLLHCRLSGDNAPGEMRQSEKVLSRILFNSLRSSDILTRLQPDYYLQLFVGLSSDELRKIISRINSRFQSECSWPEISINWEVEEM